jgi:hypothetical protein
VQAAAGRPLTAALQATDFSAFNAMVRSQRQQHQGQQQQGQQQQGQKQQEQQRPPPGGSQRPPRQQVQVTTFDVITSNRVNGEELDPALQLEGVSALLGLPWVAI